MKSSILEALFNSEDIPWQWKPLNNPAHLALEEKIRHEWRYIIDKLSPEDRLHCEILEDLRVQALSNERKDSYYQGFSVGVTMMVEVMMTKKRMEDE